MRRCTIDETELYRRIPEFEAVPADGVRVWPGGVATVHRQGRAVEYIAGRVVYAVVSAPAAAA